MIPLRGVLEVVEIGRVGIGVRGVAVLISSRTVIEVCLIVLQWGLVRVHNLWCKIDASLY